MATVDIEEYDQGLQELQRQHARDALRVIIARSEAGTNFENLPAGSFAEVGLSWDRGNQIVAADIERIVVERTSGDCTSIDVEIRSKAGGTGEDIAYAFPTGNVPVFDEQPFPKPLFLSEGTGVNRYKIWLVVKPNGGVAANSFRARVYARPRR